MSSEVDPRSNRGRVAWILAAVLLVFAACEVPTDSAPQAIPAEGVPFSLLESSLPPTTTQDQQGVPRTLYFVRIVDNSPVLVEVTRQFAPGDAVASNVLISLIDVPPNPDVPDEAGYSSRINPSAELLDTSLDLVTGTLTITIGGLFSEGGLQGPDLITALAQIVYTATAERDVTAVLFRNEDDEPRSALTPSGEVADPVDRDDYRSLRPVT